mmetsp:Transcript_10917/g.17888  ORF Transcript_10917/g.17888 Transcript_10917/m.17888 type:complete len:334 (+) Transcript_10917:60-1061(+)
MGRYAQFVVGPAGSGKSTYCFTIQNFMNSNKHRLPALVVNLDPGQERTEKHEEELPFDADVRDLISVSDVIEELGFGPNGALVFCMEHLVENLEWLKDSLDEIGSSDDEYFIFDCPGQIELYTHIPVLRTIIKSLESWNINVCVVHVIDALFIDDSSKYISGSLLALTSMMQLQTAAVNIITKCDLKASALGGGRKRRPKPRGIHFNSTTSGSAALDALAKAEEEDTTVEDEDEDENEPEFLNIDDPEYLNPDPITLRESLAESSVSPAFQRLGESIADLLESYNLVSFLPLDITSEESMEIILGHIDNATQYGEDLEPRDPGETEEQEENDM